MGSFWALRPLVTRPLPQWSTGGGTHFQTSWPRKFRTHAPYGGVVPELASREHLRNIVPVVHAALSEAGVAFSDLAAIAVTEGPGLAGALLVGITYAKSLAFALGKPLIAVNHLEGHIHAVLLEQQELARTAPERRRPHVCRERLAGAGPGGLRRTHTPLCSAAASGKLYLSEYRPHRRRCRRRGL